MITIIRRFPLVSFFVLAYLFSWFYWLILLFKGLHVMPGSSVTHFPGLLGPAIAACVVQFICHGSGGLKLLLRKMIQVSRPLWKFWLYSLSPIGFLALALIVLGIKGMPIPSIDDFARFSGLPELGLPAIVIIVFLIGGYGEELGWRGFALERMQRRFGPLGGAVLLAFLWAGWHIPSFGVIQIYRQMTIPMILGGFLLGIICGSIVIARVANITKGSVLAVTLWHTFYNLTSATSAGNGFVAMITTICVMIWALILVVREWRRSRENSLLDIAAIAQ